MALSSGLGNLLGGALSGLFSAGGNAMSAFMNLRDSKALAKYQNDLQISNNRRMYSDSRYSLESAGYNPLLAVGSSAGSQSVSMPTYTGNDYGTSVTNALTARLNKGQLDLMEKQGQTQDAQSQNLDADTQLKNNEYQWLDYKNQAYVDQMYSQVGLNNANEGLALANKISQEINNQYGHQRNQAELKNLEASAYSLVKNAISNATQAQASMQNSISNALTAESNDWRNRNTSRGYTSHFQFGPLSFSHTGDPNGYTDFKHKKPRDVYETINGKRVKVRTYD